VNILIAIAAIVTGTIVPSSSPMPSCHADQPVYSSAYQLVGSWQVTLPLGQSVTLPDGDTATCTRNGLYVP
jgi:hypothetical protein